MADYWAIGILIFEMLVGDPPFSVPGAPNDPRQIFKRILDGQYTLPNFLNDAAADMIWNLLQASGFTY